VSKPRPPRDPSGSIRRDELLTLRTLQKRLGWGEHAIRQARQAGLRLIRFGNTKYCLGVDLLAFFERLAEEQSNGTADGGGEGGPW